MRLERDVQASMGTLLHCPGRVARPFWPTTYPGPRPLISLSAVTHAFDQNQRLLTLPFTPGSGALTVTAPANNNLAPPGYYQLFVVNDAGVPSVGRMVRIAPVP